MSDITNRDFERFPESGSSPDEHKYGSKKEAGESLQDFRDRIKRQKQLKFYLLTIFD